MFGSCLFRRGCQVFTFFSIIECLYNKRIDFTGLEVNRQGKFLPHFLIKSRYFFLISTKIYSGLVSPLLIMNQLITNLVTNISLIKIPIVLIYTKIIYRFLQISMMENSACIEDKVAKKMVKKAVEKSIREISEGYCQGVNKNNDGHHQNIDDHEGNKQNIKNQQRKDSKDSKESKLSRQRSGSVPSQKINKQSDVQSISTMTGTLPSHKSDNRIQDIDPRKSTNLVIPKNDLESNPQQAKQQSTWTLDKNGCITSPNTDITPIKYYFIKSASKYGMSVMRDLQDLITIKTQRLDSFKCLFMMCLPMFSVADRCVYQLERYKDKNGGSRLRLVLISGSKFEEFKRSFYYELWQKNVLKLSNFQALTLLCYANRKIIAQVIQNYEQACNQFQIKNLSSEEQLQIWQNNLMRKFKSSQQKLKSTIFSSSSVPKPQHSSSIPPSTHPIIPRTPINQILLQRILLYEISICELYLKIEMDTNRQLCQKKKYIKSWYSVRKIFQYLEINLKLLTKEFMDDKRKIDEINCQCLPYYEAVCYLNELNIVLSPLQNIGKIANFNDKLLQCFQNSLGRSDSMMDMDNQLPLTIYCILVSTNKQLKPIIAFLRDYFEPEDDFECQNRTLAALKAALEYVRQEWVLEGRSQSREK